ncbi:MAG: isoprenylcysteine carboxylmethyltransferase family protein [Gemmatimonadota bacterium]|nr:MAG: isoprenylcysteine carboxylmethyltransferase family protein [Gemmatimonadota bacterium]
MSLLRLFHSVATGSRWKRELLTPLGLLVFGATLAVVVVLGLFTDRLLRMPELLPGSLGVSIGVVLLVLGSTLCGWCVLRFTKAKGTPVPFNPPKELVVTGPYVWMRNPMVTGVFAGLFGLGFIFHSLSIVLIWTPLYVLAHVIELKKVEEPELELRFGAAYTEYKRAVPMFIPRPWRRGSVRSGQ